jgi:hypothetical protein
MTTSQIQFNKHKTQSLGTAITRHTIHNIKRAVLDLLQVVGKITRNPPPIAKTLDASLPALEQRTRRVVIVALYPVQAFSISVEKLYLDEVTLHSQ